MLKKLEFMSWAEEASLRGRDQEEELRKLIE